MIDWKKSAELNKCSIDNLKLRFEKFPKSNKKVIAICDDCGKIRNLYFSYYSNICKMCWGKKMGLNNYGKNNPQYGKTGELSPRFNKKHTKETKKKISESHKGLMIGENNPAWKGGIKYTQNHLLTKAACIKLNEKFIESEFHHITRSIGVFIPKELHQHIRHNLRTGKNLGEINLLSLQFINGGL